MIVRAEDRGKIIGLLAAIGVIAVIFIFRILQVTNPTPVPAEVVALSGPGASKTATASANPGPVVVVSTPPNSSAPPSGGGSSVALNDPAFSLSDSGSDQIDPPNLFASSTADPFRKIAKPAEPKPQPRAKRSLVRPMDPGFDYPAPPRLANPEAPLPIAATDDFPKLNGVMPQDNGNGVAVLSTGKDSYVLKTGQSFGDGFTVVSITATGVKLKKGSTTVDLSVSN